MNKENKTKLIKITFIILMVFISVFSIISTSSYAVGGIGPGIDGGNAENVEKIKTVTAKVIGIIQWIGLAISVVMLIAIGIQFFTVSTNPDEKAKAKEKLTLFFIGFVLILSATTILSLIQKYALPLVESSSTNTKVNERPIHNHEKL